MGFGGERFNFSNWNCFWIKSLSEIVNGFLNGSLYLDLNREFALLCEEYKKKSIKWKIKKAIEHEWHSLDGFSFIRPSKSVPSKTLDSMYILITVVTRDSHRAFHHTNTHKHPHIRIPAAPLVCVINCACFVFANGWLLIYACCNYRPTMSLGSSRQVSSRVDESSPVVMKPLATW